MDFRNADDFSLGQRKGCETLLHDIFVQGQPHSQHAVTIEGGWNAIQRGANASGSAGAPEKYVADSLAPPCTRWPPARDDRQWPVPR